MGHRCMDGSCTRGTAQQGRRHDVQGRAEVTGYVGYFLPKGTVSQRSCWMRSLREIFSRWCWILFTEGHALSVVLVIDIFAEGNLLPVVLDTFAERNLLMAVLDTFAEENILSAVLDSFAKGNIF